MYVNGYYSEWFEIKSGVAQGCPLSPLLFLVVAEALNASLAMERKIEGIDVKGKKYKLSQFADDTSPLLGSVEEIPYVDRALRRWCRATGMRENVAKREGLALGRYRGQLPPGEHGPQPNLGARPEGIKWAQEGGWCVSLGVPLGNDLNEPRWWAAKIGSIRQKTTSWVGMYRTGYLERNLIVQGCYLGRMRYWVYSI